MGFRKKRGASLELRQWRSFVDENQSLFDDAGLPLHIREERAVFDDFLMHGHVDHHFTPYDFTFNQLSSDQVAALRQIVVNYLAAGFSDPGIIVFDPEACEAIRQEALSSS